MIGEENRSEGAVTRSQKGIKRKSEEIEGAIVSNEKNVRVKNLKQWKINPDNDEGVKVPQPKLVHKANGLKYTDFIIGKGAPPKPGAVLRITYECLSPEGELFDSVKKKKDALLFRKGLRQVVLGLDIGIEGMRIGGAREILVPPLLGYGAESFGKIPANQPLVFRVKLVGVAE